MTARCLVCGVKYEGDNAVAEMEQHVRFCQCWHCKRLCCLPSGRDGNCGGGEPFPCERMVLDEKELSATKAREKAWKEETERMASKNARARARHEQGA